MINALDFFKSEKFMQFQHWFHSALAAVSMTYFLSLIGADESLKNSLIIAFSNWCFSISLTFNACIATLILVIEKDGEFFYDLITHKKFKWIITTSYVSFFCGAFFLIMFFSITSSLLFIFGFISIYYVFFKTMKELTAAVKFKTAKLEAEIISMRTEILKNTQQKD